MGPLFWAVARVLCLVCVAVSLLRVTKTRLRHIPTRRTRVPRHQGETTLWLERLANAIVDMLYAEAGVPGGQTSLSPQQSHSGSTSNSSGSSVPQWRDGISGKRTSTERDVDSDEWWADSERSGEGFFDDNAKSGEGSGRPTFLTTLEERVNAALEDSGVASWADFRVRSLGRRPPRIKAIHVVHSCAPLSAAGVGAAATTGNAAVAVGAASGAVAPSATTAGVSPSTPSAAHGGSGTSATVNSTAGLEGSGVPTAAGSVAGTAVTENDANGATVSLSASPKPTTSVPAHGAPPSLSTPVSGRRPTNASFPTNMVMRDLGGGDSGNSHPSSNGIDVNISNPTHSSTNSHGSSVPPGLTSLDIEAEVEYSGGLDVSLRADLSFLRGRQLPFRVRFHKVRYVGCHMRAAVSLQYESPTMEADRKPFLLVTLWLESDPAFDLTMRTSVTRLSIRDFFVIPLLVRFFLLRYVRSKLKRAYGGAGVVLRVPLPESTVDGGEHWPFPGGDGTAGPGLTPGTSFRGWGGASEATAASGWR